jgi:N-carbamoyl-L-amino-acid hydrolase
MAVAWTNEEGSRFQPGAMGSAVFADRYDLDEMLQVKDWKGVVLKDALAETLKTAPAPLREGKPGFAVDGYIEVHIEQGPRLENAQKTIGVVTGIQGSRRYIVTIDGEEAHAGTTPRAARKDAYAAATRLAAALYEATDDRDDTLRFTIGRVEVSPGSPNTVPGRVSFTIDMRHPDDAVLVEREAVLERLLAEKTKPCAARLERVTNVPPTNFDRTVIDLVRAKAQALKLSNMDMPSGAGHDAMHIAKLCPAGMIFVPCERGISHNEIENASPSDLAAGTKVLVEVLEALANR